MSPPPLLKRKIESLCAGGMTAAQISKALGCDLRYASRVCTLLRDARRADPAPDHTGDDRHIALIHAHGHAFPFYLASLIEGAGL